MQAEPCTPQGTCHLPVHVHLALSLAPRPALLNSADVQVSAHSVDSETELTDTLRLRAGDETHPIMNALTLREKAGIMRHINLHLAKRDDGGESGFGTEATGGHEGARLLSQT